MTEAIEVGQVLAGKYRVERLLGSGGMGYVLLASHLELHQRVALKLLHRELGDLPEALSRFMQEGRTAARLRSEHVGKVLDVGRLPSGEAYLVMEFLEGHDLAQEIAQHSPVAIATAVDYVLQACEAVAEAHALGIVHRDLKPANLFLARTAYGEHCIKVLDFGISKIRADANFAVSSPALTGSHTIMGSPSYMAPEQMRASRDVDGRTDIWALGTILYELIAGCSAFTGDTLAVVCSAVLNDVPASLQALRPNLPPGLEAIILRCLDKQPSLRYSNVAELVHDLVSFAPAQSRDAVERISRLVGDLAPEQLKAFLAARAALQSAPPGQSSDDRAIPPTLSMLHQPSPALAARNPDAAISINLNSTRTAPGTGVVWSGTDLGVPAKSKARRSLVVGIAALMALAGGIFVTFRLRGAQSISRASAGAPAAAVEPAARGSGPTAAGAPMVSASTALAAPSEQPTAKDPSAAKRIDPSAALPVLDGRRKSMESKAIEPLPGKTASRPLPGAVLSVPPQPQVPTKAVEPVATRPEPPKAEPAAVAPSRSSRITDYGGRE